MISIIIPAHNEATNLQRLLPMLNSFTVDVPFEVIVALSPYNDDHSESLVVHDNVKFINCQEKGGAVQMNLAADIALGDILVFLHADVLPPKSFLKDIVSTLKNRYEAGFFSYRFDKKSLLLKINAKFTANDGIFTGGGDQCLFIKKPTFIGIGKFNENQVLMEDFEFFDRMKKSNVPYKIIKNDLIVSARKYDNNSYLRVNCSNLLLVLLYKFGYPAPKLKSLHNRLLRTSSQSNT